MKFIMAGNKRYIEITESSLMTSCIIYIDIFLCNSSYKVSAHEK